MTDRPEDSNRRATRMARVDAMPPEIRACVHEYGLTIVDAMLDLGIKKAKQIRHLVDTVRRESYQGPRDMAPMRREDEVAQ
jgi:hypothetical protein